MKKALPLFALGLIVGLVVAALLCWFWVIPCVNPMQGAVAKLQIGDIFTLPGVGNEIFSLQETDLQLIVYLPDQTDWGDVCQSVDAFIASQEGLSVRYLLAPDLSTEEMDLVHAMQCEVLPQTDYRQKTPVWWVVDTEYCILCRAESLLGIEEYLATR